MNTNEFSALLKECLQQSNQTPSTNHCETVKKHCAHALAQQSTRQRIGFGSFLFLQLRFIGWKIWLLQGSILACMLIVFLLPVMDCLTLGELTKAICAFSLLTGTSTLPLFYLSFYYRMHELEAASRFSSVKLFAAKGLIIMAGNIFLLAGSFGTAYTTTTLASQTIALALLLPFVLSMSGTLYCWAHFHASTAFYAGLLWNGFLLILTIGTPQLYEHLSQQPSLWTGFGLLSFFFCIVQGIRLGRHPHFSDNQCHLI